MLKGFLEATVRDAVTYTEHSRRKTVRADAKNNKRIREMQSTQEEASARAYKHAKRLEASMLLQSGSGGEEQRKERVAGEPGLDSMAAAIGGSQQVNWRRVPRAARPR